MIMRHILLLVILAFAHPLVPSAAFAGTSITSETPFGAVYTDEHPGRAGVRKNTSDNVYHFNISKASGRAVVHVDATKPAQDSKGDIMLVYDNKVFVIGQWNKDPFPKQGINLDANKYITKPGKYEIRFDYRGGHWALNTSKVSIDTRK